jgi:hypothetical protein
MSAANVYRYKTRLCDCRKKKANTIIKVQKIKTVASDSKIIVPFKNIYTSKYIGVSWDANKNKWRAEIENNCKCHHLGYFDHERDAAFARAYAEESLFGKVAELKISISAEELEAERSKRKYNISVSDNGLNIEKILTRNEYLFLKEINDNLGNILDISKIEETR